MEANICFLISTERSCGVWNGPESEGQTRTLLGAPGLTTRVLRTRSHDQGPDDPFQLSDRGVWPFLFKNMHVLIYIIEKKSVGGFVEGKVFRKEKHTTFLGTCVGI